MKRHLFPIILVLAAITLRGSGQVMAITWGETDGTRHPNVAAIVVETDWPWWGTFQLASGTLIDDKVVLTAGHVINTLRGMLVADFIHSIDQVHISFDPTDCRNPNSWLPISDLVIDDSFYDGNGGADDHHTDLGAVILATPSPELPKATLPDAGFLDGLKKAGRLKAGPKGTNFAVVGYGARLDWPPPEPIWDTVDRRFAYSGYLGLNDSFLHMSQNQATGNGGTGFGDSGGPTFLTWTNPDTGEEQEILVAVTSWGDPNLVAMSFSYRVDTEHSLSFIDSVLGSVEE